MQLVEKTSCEGTVPRLFEKVGELLAYQNQCSKLLPHHSIFSHKSQTILTFPTNEA